MLRPPPIDLLGRAFLFLDFDGTLVTLAPRPDEVAVDARLRALVRDLVAMLPGRLAIVSGRPADQIAAYFTGVAVNIGGSHGLELRWADGRMQAPQPVSWPISLPISWMADAMARAEALRIRHPHVLIEAKPFGLALHYRQAPEAEDACRALASALADAHGLAVQPGKMVFEVRDPGADKGDAVRFFMSGTACERYVPVFLGDDITDEAGFRAAGALGGCGVLIGAPRATAARYRLADVSATLGWLEAAARVAA